MQMPHSAQVDNLHEKLVLILLIGGVWLGYHDDWTKAAYRNLLTTVQVKQKIGTGALTIHPHRQTPPQFPFPFQAIVPICSQQHPACPKVKLHVCYRKFGASKYIPTVDLDFKGRLFFAILGSPTNQSGGKQTGGKEYFFLHNPEKGTYWMERPVFLPNEPMMTTFRGSPSNPQESLPQEAVRREVDPPPGRRAPVALMVPAEAMEHVASVGGPSVLERASSFGPQATASTRTLSRPEQVTLQQREESSPEFRASDKLRRMGMGSTKPQNIRGAAPYSGADAAATIGISQGPHQSGAAVPKRGRDSNVQDTQGAKKNKTDGRANATRTAYDRQGPASASLDQTLDIQGGEVPGGRRHGTVDLRTTGLPAADEVDNGSHGDQRTPSTPTLELGTRAGLPGSERRARMGAVNEIDHRGTTPVQSQIQNDADERSGPAAQEEISQPVAEQALVSNVQRAQGTGVDPATTQRGPQASREGSRLEIRDAVAPTNNSAATGPIQRGPNENAPQPLPARQALLIQLDVVWESAMDQVLQLSGRCNQVKRMRFDFAELSTPQAFLEAVVAKVPQSVVPAGLSEMNIICKRTNRGYQIGGPDAEDSYSLLQEDLLAGSSQILGEEKFIGRIKD